MLVAVLDLPLQSVVGQHHILALKEPLSKFYWLQVSTDDPEPPVETVLHAACSSVWHQLMDQPEATAPHVLHYELVTPWWKKGGGLRRETEAGGDEEKVKQEEAAYSTYSEDMKEDNGPTSFAFWSACFWLNAASASSSS